MNKVTIIAPLDEPVTTDPRTVDTQSSFPRWSLGTTRAVQYLAVVILTLLSTRQAAAEDLNETPLELRPYKVQLLVAFDGQTQSNQMRTDVLEATRQAARRCVGSCWQLTIAEAGWLQPVTADALSRLSASDLTAQTHQELDQFDVWLIAGVRSSGSGFRVDVRSWQPAIGVQPDTISADAYDVRDVPLTILQLSHAAFRPVGIVDDVDGKNVRVLLQAAAISVPDPAFALTRHAKLFVPVLATRNRDQKIERLLTVPWTYLSVTESKDVGLRCEMHSGLRAPISGKPRGRTSTLAVSIKAAYPATLLELATQSKPSLPLVAHRVELRDSPDIPPADSPDKDEHLLDVLLTDRRGHVTVPAESGSLVWLFAYSGRHLLARVPIVPGMSERMRLEVPDDSARLAAESDLYTLQGQLIEAVAARTTVISRIRAAIKKNEVNLAKSGEAELKKLAAPEIYLEKVTAIRVPAVKAAKARKDKIGEARINRMCDEMAELIKQHLSEDKRQAVLEELKVFTDDTALENTVPDEAKK